MSETPVHDIWIPAPHRELTGGVERVQLPGERISDLIDELDDMFPGIKSRLCNDDKLRPNISVAVNGSISHFGMRQRLSEPSEIHFIPAIGGGA